MARADILPALTSNKDESLQLALQRMLANHESAMQAGDDDPAVTAVRRLAPQAAVFAPFPASLDARVQAAYASRGIEQLYSHQAEAIGHALAGRNVVVVTPTASGKTLCYNVPVLDAILQDPASRALYLFPTKALAQDQLAELHQMAEILGSRSREAGAAGTEAQAERPIEIGVFTYDGDTPQDARRAIRGKAHVVLSNPDMVHAGILPHHPRWAKLFENLKFIVIDELHTYRGVFGSHLANILRRLQRVCRHYGSDPVFICSSATIANPKELAERLTHEPFELVEKSGAPRGEKFFLFANPPVVNHQLGIRRSYLAETRRVAIEFLKRGLQVIVFAQSRLSTEILTTYLKDAFAGPPGAQDVIRGYRGGYLPIRRREIERGLRDGHVRCVVSTNALELGIDIGALDVTVMAGYPGSIAATWQRAGRAGRRSGRSAAVLVASSAPIDQFVVRHPDYFFDASPEHALVNPDNLHILLAHLKCAAFELPFRDGDVFGDTPVDAVLAVLSEEGFVHHADSQWQWTHESYPADAISLRSVTSDNFVIIDRTNGERVIGETDFTSGPAVLHEKAIYLLEGQIYQVETLDFDNRKAFVRAVDCDYYTDAIDYSKVTVLDIFAGDALPQEPEAASSTDVARLAAGLDDGDSQDAARAATKLMPAAFAPPPVGEVSGAACRSHGEVHVVTRVVGFKKIKFYTNENVGAGELDLPEQNMHTTSYWLRVPDDIVQALPYGTDDRRDGISGIAFAMHNIAPLLLMCDQGDLGVSIDRETIFLYDNYPGGIGFSEPLFSMHDELMMRTRQLIDECPCETGCPSCVGPIGATGPNTKRVAQVLLQRIGAAPTPRPVL